jgi:MarR family transcriptional regulator, transcriptional regulator for hemolysin
MPVPNTPSTPVVNANPAKAEKRLPILLRHAWYGLNQAFRRRTAHLGITPDQFIVMRNLAEGERAGLTQSQLTELMGSDPNTMAALIERMETHGWVERRPHERDRRAQRIRLKPAGRRKYGLLRAIALELQQEVLRTLPEERRDSFLEELSAVAATCRAIADDSQEA